MAVTSSKALKLLPGNGCPTQLVSQNSAVIFPYVPFAVIEAELAHIARKLLENSRLQFEFANAQSTQ